jgi:hypothetical protein
VKRDGTKTHYARGKRASETSAFAIRNMAPRIEIRAAARKKFTPGDHAVHE